MFIQHLRESGFKKKINSRQESRPNNVIMTGSVSCRHRDAIKRRSFVTVFINNNITVVLPVDFYHLPDPSPSLFSGQHCNCVMTVFTPAVYFSRLGRSCMMHANALFNDAGVIRPIGWIMYDFMHY